MNKSNIRRIEDLEGTGRNRLQHVFAGLARWGWAPSWSWSESITRLIWKHLTLWNAGSWVRHGSGTRTDIWCPVSHLVSLNPNSPSIKPCDDNNSLPVIFIGVRMNRARKWTSRTVSKRVRSFPARSRGWNVCVIQKRGSEHLPSAWSTITLESTVCLFGVTDPFEGMTTVQSCT